MKKKILFMIHDLSVGGAEKVLVNLVNNMDADKYDITVISLFGGGVNEQFLKTHIHYQSIYMKTIPGNSKLMKILTPEQLHKKYIKEKYDIEISYLEGPTARIISGCTNENTKLVCWIHVEQHTKKIAAKAFRSYRESQKCYAKFDKIVAVSGSVKSDFEKVYPNIRKLDVLYNTNETDQILKLKEEVVEKELYDESIIRICGVGKVVKNKGFMKLAHIHRKLVEEGFKIHTYILGIGDEKDSIEQYLKDNSVSESFTFLGYQTNPYKYLNRMDIFVCSSIAEGFSTAATEGLITECAVVTTPVAGMKEMLGENNEYGIITEMSEESLYRNIKALLESPEKLKYYKKQAKTRSKFFSTENTVNAVENYIEKLLIK